MSDVIGEINYKTEEQWMESLRLSWMSIGPNQELLKTNLLNTEWRIEELDIKKGSKKPEKRWFALRRNALRPFLCIKTRLTKKEIKEFCEEDARRIIREWERNNVKYI